MSIASDDGGEARLSKGAFEALQNELPGRRCLVVVGLPGTGKSLLVRDTARHAATLRRRVHLLQWDVARLSWDTPEILARFPETDGVTHAGIRAALGLWVRATMAQWFQAHASDDDLLIVEAPIIGGRFAELARRIRDPLESRLAGQEALFVVVAPTRQLQHELRRLRARETGVAQHALERHNATVAVLDMQVAAVERVAPLLGLAAQFPGTYDPDLYVAVMRATLKHRNAQVLRPDELIEAGGSVYECAGEVSRIEARQVDVTETIAHIIAQDPERLRKQVEIDWALN